MPGTRLKKPSVASSAWPKQPERELIFFLDRQLGRYKVANTLRAAGLRVEIHDAHLPPDAEDTQWLRLAGENGWVVITRDERIRYRRAEMRELRRAKVRAFVVVARGNLRAESIADIILRSLPQMRETVQLNRPPFVAKIWRDGKLAIIAT